MASRVRAFSGSRRMVDRSYQLGLAVEVSVWSFANGRALTHRYVLHNLCAACTGYVHRYWSDTGSGDDFDNLRPRAGVARYLPTDQRMKSATRYLSARPDKGLLFTTPAVWSSRS